MKCRDTQYLVLFSFCKVVKGKQKSVICDFQKEKIKFIPNEMVEVIRMLQKQPFEIVREYFKKDAEIFDSYIKFLIAEGFAFYNKSRENFIEIENYWASPEVINNAVIEYGFKNYNLKNILIQLDYLYTKFIELRFNTFEEEHVSELEEILNYCENSILRSIRLYFPYTKDYLKKIIELAESYSIIDCIIFYNSKLNRTLEKDNRQTFFITQTLESITSSNIDKKFLINNLEYYYECQKHNPYYNKKVSIDSNGQIKNCIKNRAVFGNVKNDLISNVVSTEQFQEFWYVTHDQIIDVQNSELRYNYIISNDLEKLKDGKFKIVI